MAKAGSSKMFNGDSDAAQQIVGREPSHVVARRQLGRNAVVCGRVNSTVMPRRFENLAVWFLFTRRAEVAVIARDEQCCRWQISFVVARSAPRCVVGATHLGAA